MILVTIIQIYQMIYSVIADYLRQQPARRLPPVLVSGSNSSYSSTPSRCEFSRTTCCTEIRRMIRLSHFSMISHYPKWEIRHNWKVYVRIRKIVQLAALSKTKLLHSLRKPWAAASRGGCRCDAFRLATGNKDSLAGYFILFRIHYVDFPMISWPKRNKHWIEMNFIPYEPTWNRVPICSPDRMTECQFSIFVPLRQILLLLLLVFSKFALTRRKAWSYSNYRAREHQIRLVWRAYRQRRETEGNNDQFSNSNI